MKFFVCSHAGHSHPSEPSGEFGIYCLFMFDLSNLCASVPCLSLTGLLNSTGDLRLKISTILFHML